MVDLLGRAQTRRRIAADTSSIQRYLAGKLGRDTTVLDEVFENDGLFLPPAVLTEVLSDTALLADAAIRIRLIPLLETTPGYWERAGVMRAALLAIGRKAKLPDTLIAQSCIDHDIPLITYDRDFRHFTGAGLILI